MNELYTKEDLLKKTKTYFDSIKAQFDYRQKNLWKFNIVDFFFSISLIIFNPLGVIKFFDF